MWLLSRLFVFKYFFLLYFKFSNIFGLFLLVFTIPYVIITHLIHAFYFTFVKINKIKALNALHTVYRTENFCYLLPPCGHSEGF